MKTKNEPQAKETIEPDTDIIHVSCCRTDYALCGIYADEMAEDWEEADCVVCLDLEDTDDCPVFGFCKE